MILPKQSELTKVGLSVSDVLERQKNGGAAAGPPFFQISVDHFKHL